MTDSKLEKLKFQLDSLIDCSVTASREAAKEGAKWGVGPEGAMYHARERCHKQFYKDLIEITAFYWPTGEDNGTQLED